MKIKGWDLNFFNTGEWQVCDEKLQELERTGERVRYDGYCPGRQNLFKALQITPLDKVRVAIIGQDPYPTMAHSTGVAFSIPESIPRESYPNTLRTIFKEYTSDLGYNIPSNGCLIRWATQGVLLWNAVPSCLPGKSLSHDWTEWSYLTKEIVRRLSSQGIVFALLGQVARRYQGEINLSNNYVITTSHPSPRGSANAKTPFLGSRLFSTINAKLVENGQEIIDWRLP